MKTLKEHRIEKGYSVQELAKEVGVTRQSIYNYENEGFGSANVHTLANIVMVLGIDVNQLDLELNKEEKK